MKLKLSLIWWPFAFFLLFAVIFLSFYKISMEAGFSLSDKLMHIIAYFSLMLFFSQLFQSAKAHLILAVLFTILGGLIEIGQGFTGYREASVLDLFANMIGIFIAWFLVALGAYRLFWFIEYHILRLKS